MRPVTIITILSIWFAGCGSDDDNTPGPPNGNASLTVTDFAPMMAAHDSIVTITGEGFNPSASGNTVTLNGIAVTITSSSDTELKIKVPKNKNCSGSLKVSVAGKDATASTPFAYKLTYTVSTVAGNSIDLRASKDGTGTNAKFFKPTGIFLDATGIIYVTDELGYRIRKISNGNLVTTIAGSDDNGKLDGPISSATFTSPYAITMNENGFLCVLERSGNRIRLIKDGQVSTLAGSAIGFKDGLGTDAKFNVPSGIAVNAQGKIYIADSDNNRIRTISDGLVKTFAGSGKRGHDDGNGLEATFGHPKGIAVDGDGNIYVTDSEVGFNAIRKITPSGAVTTIAGGPFTASVDGTGAAAKFVSPKGIAIDLSGNLYVTDKHQIRMITPAGVVTTIAGYELGFVDGIGANAEFFNPVGIAVDAAGTIYVADSDNDRIRKLVGE